MSELGARKSQQGPGSSQDLRFFGERKQIIAASNVLPLLESCTVVVQLHSVSVLSGLPRLGCWMATGVSFLELGAYFGFEGLCSNTTLKNLNFAGKTRSRPLFVAQNAIRTTSQCEHAALPANSTMEINPVCRTTEGANFTTMAINLACRSRGCVLKQAILCLGGSLSLWLTLSPKPLVKSSLPQKGHTHEGA